MVMQIAAPYFTAGIVIKDDQVTDAAPILAYMVGWSADRVVKYATDKHWRCQVVKHDG
jgi:hypothetical protein